MTAWVNMSGSVALSSDRGRVYFLEAICGTNYCRANKLSFSFKLYITLVAVQVAEDNIYFTRNHTYTY